MYVGILLAFAAFASDIYTAIVLLAFDRWSSTIEPYVPFRISRWLFGGCIILSVLLYIHDFIVAYTTIRTKNISLNYTDPIARNIYSIRGYRYFCLFVKLTKSRSKTEYLALFVYFSFKGWIRLVFADSPRQVLNALTLYSVLQISDDFVSTVKKLAQHSLIEAVVIGFMAFSLLVWVFNIIQFGLALLFAIPLYVHIGDSASGLEEYCCVKVNDRIARLVEKYHRKGMIELAAANKKLDKQPSLPRVDTSNLDDYNEKAKTHYSIDQLSELHPYRKESIKTESSGNGVYRNGNNVSSPRLLAEVSTSSLNSLASAHSDRQGYGYQPPPNNDNDMAPLLDQKPKLPVQPRTNQITQQGNGYPGGGQYPNSTQKNGTMSDPRLNPAYNPNQRKAYRRPKPYESPYQNGNQRGYNGSQTSLKSDPYRNVPFPDPKYNSQQTPYPIEDDSSVPAYKQLPAPPPPDPKASSPAPTPAPTQYTYDSQAGSNPPYDQANYIHPVQNPYNSTSAYDLSNHPAPQLRNVQQPVVVVDESPKPLIKQHSLPIFTQNNPSKAITRQQTMPSRISPAKPQTAQIDNNYDPNEQAALESRKSKLSPFELMSREPKLPSLDGDDQDGVRDTTNPVADRQPTLPSFEDEIDEDDDLIVYDQSQNTTSADPASISLKDKSDDYPLPKSPPLLNREPTLPSFNEEDLSIHTPQLPHHASFENNDSKTSALQSKNPFFRTATQELDSFDLLNPPGTRNEPPVWRSPGTASTSMYREPTVPRISLDDDESVNENVSNVTASTPPLNREPTIPRISFGNERPSDMHHTQPSSTVIRPPGRPGQFF